MTENKMVYLNGEYLPLNEAKVSVLDRGFLFGDGIYEVIPSYSGHLFHFQDHLQRLENSLAGIRLANPHTREEWLAILSPLLDTTIDQYIYLQITRGVGPKRDHAFPDNIPATVFAMCSAIVPFAGLNQGVKAVSMDDSRWQFCNIKAITLLGNILHRQEAIDQGCAEALLVKDGYVVEGAASNVFAVIDGVLCTPPKGNDILPGITRDVILELARKNNIACSEYKIPFAKLQTASEIWVTSSTREIVPIVELDSIRVSDGKPGPVWHAMQQIFQDYKKSLIMSEQTFFEFPCQFPVKAMGKADMELDLLVIEIVRRHVPDVKPDAVTSRPSKDGNFIAITVVIEASSKKQLDAIYQDLSDHPHVLMAL
ncbi:DUF493 family protein [Methylobacter psychrophilus]|uniref:DUF493 family protein n=1 Tax=Methylobacter psychrophilus TaxID=96941 RepID=UPI002948BDD5|nr:DUF493 family protein [Methylobacter psychrophilus]